MNPLYSTFLKGLSAKYFGKFEKAFHGNIKMPRLNCSNNRQCLLSRILTAELCIGYKYGISMGISD